MYKGAVFFDYDGTLTDETESIYSPTERTLSVLEKLRANGYATFLATGRMKPCTRIMTGKFSGLVTSNGAYAEIGGKCVHNHYIDTDIQNKAIEYMKAHNIRYALETQKGAYTDGTRDAHFLEMLDHFHMARSLYMPIEKAPDTHANKMIITYHSEQDADELEKTFEGIFTVKKHRFFLSADLDDANISKAVGARAVIDSLGIPIENTYAFGDGSNDKTMLEAVGHGIAMGYHAKCLDEVAEFVTKTVKEEGIEYALRQHYKII